MPMKGVAAVVTWTAVVMVAVRWTRAPNEKRKLTATACWALVALAVAFTIWLPAVSSGLDRVTRVPNLAQWLWNGCVLVTGYFVDQFLDILEQGVPGSRRRRVGRRVVLGVALCLMALLLWQARLRRDVADFTPEALGTIPSPALIAYQLVYALTFSIIVWRLLVFAGRDARTSRDVIVKVGTSLTALGAAAALVYFAARLPLLVLMPQTRLSFALQGIEQSSMVVAAFGTVCGTSCPVWGRHMRLRKVFHHADVTLTVWQLRGLWRTLTAAAPGTVLPTAMTPLSALLRPHEMDVLLTRRVIEILDARRMVLNSNAAAKMHESMRRSTTWGSTPPPPLPPLPRASPRDTVRRHERRDRVEPQSAGEAAANDADWVRHTARVEAHVLAQALNWRSPSSQRISSLPGQPVAAPLFEAVTLQEQIRYLKLLAVELRRVEKQARAAPVTRWRRRV